MEFLTTVRPVWRLRGQDYVIGWLGGSKLGAQDYVIGWLGGSKLNARFRAATAAKSGAWGADRQLDPIACAVNNRRTYCIKICGTANFDTIGPVLVPLTASKNKFSSLASGSSKTCSS